MEDNIIITASALAIADKRIKNSINKQIYKIRVFDPQNTKNIITYISYKLEKLSSHIEFWGYLSQPNKNKKNKKTLEQVTLVEEITEIANLEGLEELALAKPWHQIVEIETIKAKKGKTNE